MSKKGSSVVLLLSGGIDSAALLNFYIEQNEQVRCIHFNYGQPNKASELEAIKNISGRFGVEIEIINLSIPMSYRDDEVLCRNALFILSAASSGLASNRISIGIHADSPYYDASKNFIDDCQRILDGYFEGSLQIEAPFIDYTKLDIIDYCKEHNVPIDITYSCFRKNSPPCGECPSCLDRRLADEN